MSKITYARWLIIIGLILIFLVSLAIVTFVIEASAVARNTKRIEALEIRLEKINIDILKTHKDKASH